MKGSRSRSARLGGSRSRIARLGGARSTPVPRRIPRTPIAAAIMLACPALMAQQQLEEIIVTAQKRAENMQDVPISIQALGTEQLEQLHVNNFKDYVQMLPTVTMAPGAGGGYGAGAGFAAVYMRGVTTGGDGQAITSVPSVGMYLDEQPITTIQGNLDIHMYDIARVEALAGPQGTLYGASSQAGTIRIITNRPDPTGFDAGYGLEANMVDGNDSGYIAEGFVNVPIGEQAAIRLVGWYREDAGWVDNVRAERRARFPDAIADPILSDDDITISNDEFAEDDYNTMETYGARAALRVDLNDNWAITPTFMIQNQYSDGSWGDDLNDFIVSGDNAVAHFTAGVHRRRVVAGGAHDRRQHQQLRPDVLRQLPRPPGRCVVRLLGLLLLLRHLLLDRVLRRPVLRQRRQSRRAGPSIL